MILCWNARGCASEGFSAICSNLRQTYHPQIVILLETWVSGLKAEHIIRKLGFQFHIRQDAEGFSGGIWICWSDLNIQITSIEQHKQIIHCCVCMSGFRGYLSAVYGSPNSTSRKVLWEIIKNIGHNMQGN